MKPNIVSFEITENCNYSCIHCYNPYRTLKKKKRNADVSEKVLDRLIQEGIFQINFTGGEPFSRKEFLFMAIEKCLKNNIVPSINSNLSLIKHEDIPFLKKNKVSLFFSYPSVNPETYYKVARCKKSNVDKIIADLTKSKIMIGANLVVSKINLKDVVATGKHLSSLGVKSIAVTPISSAYNNTVSKKLMLSKKEYLQCYNDALLLKNENIHIKTALPVPFCAFSNPELFADLFTVSCTYGAGSMVDQEGNVHPCVAEKKIMGNILKNTYEEILAKNPYKKEIPKKCMPCKSKEYCLKGCVLMLKHLGKDIYGFPYYATKPLDYCFNPKKSASAYIDFSKITSFTINPFSSIREDGNDIYTIYSYSEHFSIPLRKEEFELLKFLHANSSKLSDYFNELDKPVINKINTFLNYLYLHKIIDINCL